MTPKAAATEVPWKSNHEESRSFWRTALAWQGAATPLVLPKVLFVFGYGLAFYFATLVLPPLGIAIEPFEYSGAVLGLLLVSRVNAGVSRWWEARQVWGSIVNQSRNLAIVGSSYGKDRQLVQQQLAWTQLWPHAMRQHLRDQRDLAAVMPDALLPHLPEIEKRTHIPVYIGQRLAQLLASMRERGLNEFAFHQAESQRALLIDAIGACERIKTTPIPFVLAIKTRRFIFLFLALLPLALAEKAGLLTPLVLALTAYPLLSLDEIGIQLQNPFAVENLSHLPLTQICQKISTVIDQIEHDVLDASASRQRGATAAGESNISQGI